MNVLRAFRPRNASKLCTHRAGIPIRAYHIQQPTRTGFSKQPARISTTTRRCYTADSGAPRNDQVSEFTKSLLQWTSSTIARAKAGVASLSAASSTNLAILGGKLNQITGYEVIEGLKKSVVQQEARIDEARTTARAAKATYELAVQTRSSCQREVNDLLQRKSTWSEPDVLRFTSLVRQDHLNEQAEAKAKIAVSQADDNIEREFQELSRTILNRYHEEQIWSDKIRSASTYGSLLALGLNLIVFVSAILVVEPYKRKRLAQLFEKRIEEMSERTEKLIQALTAKLEAQQVSQGGSALVAPLLAAVPEDDENLIPSDAFPAPPIPTVEPGPSLSVYQRDIVAGSIGFALGMTALIIALLEFRH